MKQKWQRKLLMMKMTTASAVVEMMMMKREPSQRFDLCPATRQHVSDHTEDEDFTINQTDNLKSDGIQSQTDTVFVFIFSWDEK